MFKIGDFSRLSQVSVKTLRFYDEIGLLRPQRIDETTGYRYYAAEQLPRLNRILALKDLGFTLEQIAPILAEGLSPEQLRGMLRLKQAEIQQRMQDEQAILERVKTRLRQIEQEGKMSSYEVVLKNVAPLKVASLRETLPTYSDVGRLLYELSNYVGRHGGRPAGPCAAIWHENEHKESDIDTEAYVPIEGDLAESERVRVHALPAVETMASVVHHGSYRDFNAAYQAILNWIAANGYRIVGPNREIYLKAPDNGSQTDESCVSEIQFPVEKAA